MEHKEIDVSIPVNITDEIVMDLWNVFKSISDMAQAKEFSQILMVTDAIGTTLYSAAAGNLDEIVEEMYIEDSIKDLDQKLKELLEDE